MLSRLFSLTTLSKVVKATDQTFKKNGFEGLSFFFVNFLCWHFLNISQSSHLCLSVILYKLLSHFSLSSLALPLQVVQHHQKLLIMASKMLLFAQLCKLLFNILRHMSNIELMVYFTLLFMHVMTDFLMLISGKT